MTEDNQLKEKGMSTGGEEDMIEIVGDDGELNYD